MQPPDAYTEAGNEKRQRLHARARCTELPGEPRLQLDVLRVERQEVAGQLVAVDEAEAAGVVRAGLRRRRRDLREANLVGVTRQKLDGRTRRRVFPTNPLRRVNRLQRAVQRGAVEELEDIHGGLGGEGERGEEESEEKLKVES